jgi:hypothetical protein
MAFCEGGDLANFIKKKRNVKLSEKEILDFFVQVCQCSFHPSIYPSICISLSVQYDSILLFKACFAHFILFITSACFDIVLVNLIFESTFSLCVLIGLFSDGVGHALHARAEYSAPRLENPKYLLEKWRAQTGRLWNFQDSR